MTRNQIEYLKVLESQRSNKAGEAETHRANLERERQGLLTIDETSRHNLQTEKLGFDTLAETQRANLERESETRRSNLAREAIQLAQHEETSRANRAREDIQRDTLSETARANRAREGIQSGTLAEQVRSNQAREALQQSQLAETIRFNTGSLAMRGSELEERIRSNKANEAVNIANQVVNAGNLAERVRSNIASEAETALHHRAMETKDYGTKVSLTGGSTNVTTPALPSGSKDINFNFGSGSSGNASGKNGVKEPIVLKRDVEPARNKGWFSNIIAGVTGRDVQFVKETLSNGGVQYYQEVVQDGKVIERKKITSNEFKKHK